MVEFNFGSPSNSGEHECESYRDGDWIVFRCPICLDYERKINMRTGSMVSENARADIRHSGFHIPPEVKSAFENLN